MKYLFPCSFYKDLPFHSLEEVSEPLVCILKFIKVIVFIRLSYKIFPNLSSTGILLCGTFMNPLLNSEETQNTTFVSSLSKRNKVGNSK